MSLRLNFRGLVPGALIWLSVCALLNGVMANAAVQSLSSRLGDGPEIGALTLEAPDELTSTELTATPADPQKDPQKGRITGTVVDIAGYTASGAKVQLKREGQSPTMEASSGENGQFSFDDLAPGPFELTVSADGFATQKITGILAPGEIHILPEIRLAYATVKAEVRVEAPLAEVAQSQLQEQEKQFVFGFIPNFYVTYFPDTAPLNSKQKFQLAWKSSIEPFTFAGVAAIAGLQQATDDFSGYGQGWDGYAKRFGAAYANVVTGTFIGSAILPSLLRQDPRYYYKGTGSGRSRLLYALGNVVICKGDNKKWQPNYSGIIGSFATGAVSYLYYPEEDRNVNELIIQNSLIRFGQTAFINILQEFVIAKVTPHLHRKPPPHP
jgi:hypothetical protein